MSDPELLISVHDPAAGQIVGRKLDRHLVPRQDTYKVLPHLSRNVSQHLVFVFQLDAKHSVGQGLDHSSNDFNRVFFRQTG